MARIRSLKPEFWDDRKLARSTSRDARMLYMGLWNQADEHGRVNGDEVWLKGRIFPFDEDITPGRIKELLDELAAFGRVIRYEVDGDPYLFLPKLSRHQRLEPKIESRIPPPPPVAGGDVPNPAVQFEGEHPDADESACDADPSARNADESALLYVAGSREQVAGYRGVGREQVRADAEQLCAHLADRIEANGSKRPTITNRWRDATRLMLEKDNRTEEQIIGAINWCQSDEFWRANILSMPKLREKYDQLRLAAQRASPNGRRGTDANVNAHLALAEQLGQRQPKELP